jgi:solute carrier family 25 protein 39/40
MQVPNTVIYFLSYDEFSGRLQTLNNSASWTPALAGAAARSVASFTTAPLELIRTIQASRVGADQPTVGMVAEFKSMVKKDGFLSLYKGLSPTLSRDIPFSAIYWMCIEKCRSYWGESDSERQAEGVSTEQQAGRALFNGTVSGLIAAACTTPLDVIKTRRQLQADPLSTVQSATHVCDHKGHIVYNQVQPSGTIEMLREILREEGFKGLWKGNVARMTKVAPACACMIASYEVGQRLLLAE